MKVTEVSVKNISQKQNFKASKMNVQTEPQAGEQQSEILSKDTSDAVKSNFLANISFKGYTTKARKWSSTGGTEFYNSDLIIKRNQHVETVSPVSTRAWSGQIEANLYIADPLEEVTDDIKRAHNYIIYEDEVYAGINYVRNLYRSGYHDFKSGARDEIEYFTKLKNSAVGRLLDAKKNVKEYERKYKHAVSEKEFQEEFDEPEENKNVARYFVDENKEKRDYYKSKAEEYQRQIDYADKHLSISNEKYALFEKMDNQCAKKAKVERANEDSVAALKWLKYNIKKSEQNILSYDEDIELLGKLIENDKNRLDSRWRTDTTPSMAAESVQNNIDSNIQRLEQMKNERNELQAKYDKYVNARIENENIIKDCMEQYPVLDAKLDSIMHEIEEFYNRVENNG